MAIAQGMSTGSIWQRGLAIIYSQKSICVGFYNFIRPHETLSRGQDRVFRPNTPAMAAGITDHQWTIHC